MAGEADELSTGSVVERVYKIVKTTEENGQIAYLSPSNAWISSKDSPIGPVRIKVNPYGKGVAINLSGELFT
jgi:hypothetical protein